MPSSTLCPLCQENTLSDLVIAATSGRYRHCTNCDLIAQVPDELPDSLSEFALYHTHHNDSDAKGYRDFLAQLADPLSERLAESARGLDYGAGPGPVLAELLAGRGFPTAVYDPFFAPDMRLLDASYDFVTCTEAAEHFHRPGVDFARIAEMLRTGGWLGLMTELHAGVGGFAAWWYHKDPTHVSFYSARTVDWIAGHFGFRVDFCNSRVVLLQKR